MDRRRSRVLEALAPVPGERIIEVGCGGGLLLLEIGRAVDPDGTVLGVDVSEDQVAAARRACTGVSNVRAEVGSATALDADDGCFDASVSTQVLEYIEDVGLALAELARVTRVGGRFVNVATNWDSLFVCRRRRRAHGTDHRGMGLPRPAPESPGCAAESSEPCRILIGPADAATSGESHLQPVHVRVWDRQPHGGVRGGGGSDRRPVIAIVAVQPRRSEQTRRSLHLRDADDDDGDESGVGARCSALLL